MRICPNHTKEWKMMVEHLGGNEKEAYRAFIAHNYTIPPVLSLTDFKKHVGLTSGKYSVTQQIKINKRIRLYNKQNNTSHFVNYTLYGTGELSIAEIKFNYLPVNKINQTERDRARRMERYGLLEDVESFENVYTPKFDMSLQERYTPSESEQQAGRFVDGDFLPPLYFPATEKKRIGPKFQALITSKEADRKVLYQDRDKLYTADKDASTVEEKRKIAVLLAKVNKRIDTIEDDLYNLATLDRLDQVEKYAEEDMRTLDKIFSKPNPTLQDLIIAQRIIHVWQQAGNFDGNQPHIFYDPDEFMSRNEGLKEWTTKFKQWADKADHYNLRLIDLQEKLGETKIKETFKGVNSVNFSEPLPDLNSFWSNVLDISEVDNVMFQVIHTWVKKANFAAHRELMDVKEKLDELIKAAGITDFSIFQQTFSNESSKKTGDLVYRFTQEFVDWERGIHATRKRAREKSSKDIQSYIRANINFIDQLRENSTFFDARIFFHDPELTHTPAPTEEQKKKEEARLRKLLGDQGYEDFYNLAKKQVEDYKLKREAQRSFYESEVDQELADDMFSGWEVSNSPYYYGDLMQKGYDMVTYNGKHPYPTMKFVTIVPNHEGYYDNKFKEIESDKNLLELYNYMFNLLQDLKRNLPNQKVGFMQMNSIPFLAKEVGEILASDGVAAAMSQVKDDIIKSTRIEGLSSVGSAEDQKELQIQMVHNNQSRINAYILVKDTEYRADNNGEAPHGDTVEEWRRDIIDEIAGEKSFDLDRVLNAFASASLSYKHKAMIEDQIVIMRDILGRAMERKENAAGEPMHDRFGNPLANKGLENMKKMMEDFLEVVYWGYPSNKPQGKTDKKVLTDTEKEAVKVLETTKEELAQLYKEGKISQNEYEHRLDVVNDQLAVIGGIKTWSKYGDILLKYIQLKGMGWNFFAAFSNMGFGFMSNVIEASDGRNYSNKNFWKAQSMALNSLTDGLTENGRKIRELMYLLDTLKTSKNELYKPSKLNLFRKVGDKLDWVNPYAPQSRTEYMNQAPVMVAMLMENKIKVTIDGKEEQISLWDVFESNGKVKEGITINDEILSNFKVSLDKVIKMNHGNYDPDSLIKFKRVFAGRAISQFRTWAYQGFAERFKGEFKDYQLKNQLTGEDFMIRKGRYLSFKNYWSYMQEENGMMGMGTVFNGTYQLLRKLVGAGTTFDQMVGDQFTETDAANMRKNMTEIACYLFLTAFTLMLKAGLDDEDDPKKKFAYYTLINQMGRLGTDVMFYTNPIAFERLFRNAIPAFSIVVDAAKLIDSAGILITGGEDILQSGPNKGESRTFRDFKRLVPLTVQIQKIKSAGSQEYNK